MTRKGFTLIELLVVVTVLALLASIVFSNLGGAREGARISNALSFESQTHSLLGSNLVGWWKLDDNLNDTSGYGNNGTWGGAGSPTYVDGVPGKGGKAIEFDGVGDYVDSGSDESLNIIDNLTVSVWIKTPGTITESGIYAQGSGFAGVSDPGYSLRIRQGVPGFSIRKEDNSGYVDLFDGTSIEDENWHHIVGTFNTTVARRYLNGVFEQQKSTGQSILGTTGSRIGILNGKYFNGLIDDVRIYNRALTASEVQGLYAQTKGKYLANE